MKYVYKITDIIQRDCDFYKRLIILVLCIFCIAAAVYVNLYLKEDIVYTHLFYIPIILTGIWYGMKSIYLAIYLGIFHIIINYSAFSTITVPSMHRALFFIVVALTIYLLTNFRYGHLVQNSNPDSRQQQIDMAGRLGVAVGHEIRNPLTTVRGFLQLMGNEQTYEGSQEYFSLMIEELDKADAAIGHLINLADNKTNNLKKQNLNDIVHECMNDYLFLEKHHNNIEIKIFLNKIPDIYLDGLEINQLVFNLINNAAEAMPDGGTIIISTDWVDNKVLLTITDQGKGISKEIAEHIGKPFFTTKEMSAGLGLAVSYSIARRHFARIEFISSPKGTKFIVHFPTEIPQIDEAEPPFVYTDRKVCACAD